MARSLAERTSLGESKVARLYPGKEKKGLARRIVSRAKIERRGEWDRKNLDARRPALRVERTITFNGSVSTTGNHVRGDRIIRVSHRSPRNDDHYNCSTIQVGSLSNEQRRPLSVLLPHRKAAPHLCRRIKQAEGSAWMTRQINTRIPRTLFARAG